MTKSGVLQAVVVLSAVLVGCANGSDVDDGPALATQRRAPPPGDDATTTTPVDAGAVSAGQDATTSYPSPDSSTFITLDAGGTGGGADASGHAHDSGATKPPSHDAGTSPPPPEDSGTTPPPPEDSGTTPPPPDDAGTGGSPLCGSNGLYAIEAAAALMASPEPLCGSGVPQCPAGDCRYKGIPLTCLCVSINPL